VLQAGLDPIDPIKDEGLSEGEGRRNNSAVSIGAEDDSDKDGDVYADASNK